jgi:tetratricopeptide (TPR) repeat protein
VLAGRGRVYKEIGMYDKAIEDFTRAIELEDSDPYA